MKHSQHYFTNTRITLYALFLCMIPTGANAQLFGGMMKAQKSVVAIPPTITLGQNARYFVASVYDDHYTPYTVPTGPATTGVLNVGTGNPLINVQGTISTTGVTVSIPVSCTGSSTLQAYSSNTTIPAGLTQDGIARNLTLSWAAQAYTAATKSIKATLSAQGGTLNAKKLDVNAGVGSDYLGVLLGNLVYPYNNAGNTTNFAVRVISGIPDKMYGLADNGGLVRHNFLYLAVTGEDGKVWLNNNLGADYANTTNPSFNPGQQATKFSDFHAYGSLFQWGRKPDGHELVEYGNGTWARVLTSATGTPTDNPVNTNFIIGTAATAYDWRTTPNDNAWKTESSIYNPCPSGFRVPTRDELSFYGHEQPTAYTTILGFPSVGYRLYDNGNYYYGGECEAKVWTSTMSIEAYIYFGPAVPVAGFPEWPAASRGSAYAIRCIRN